MYMFVHEYRGDFVDVDTAWIVPPAQVFQLPSGDDSCAFDPKREATSLSIA